MSNLDQFYTLPEIALECYEKLKKHVNIDDFDHIVEPSAGTGSFFYLLDEGRRLGFDIDPKCENVKKMDYLKFKPDIEKSYIVVGNPPFGKISSMAVKFFNKSAEYCDVIGFIIPRTFKRVSIQNKLNLKFHLIYSEDLPLSPCCFSPKMSAKCCFQMDTR